MSFDLTFTIGDRGADREEGPTFSAVWEMFVRELIEPNGWEFTRDPSDDEDQASGTLIGRDGEVVGSWSILPRGAGEHACDGSCITID